MPNRIIREGIITSEAVNRLSWPAEVFYRRLLNIVDDYGRYYAHCSLLKAALYPLQLDKVSDADIGKWIRETEEAALVSTYSSSGKAYLEVLRFGQQVRAKKSKFPEMLSRCLANDSNCEHVRTKAEAEAEAEALFEDEGGGGGGKSSGSFSQVVLNSLGRSSGFFSPEEMLILNELQRDKVTADDIGAAYQTTITRGKPKNNLKYLANIAREIRDLRAKATHTQADLERWVNEP